MRRPLFALAALLLLAACGDSTQSLKELRYAAPNTDPYQSALAQGYQQLAEEKLAAYDWVTSERFADKGLMATYGRDIAPEDPKTWHISPAQRAELDQARAQVVEAVTATKTTQPNQAAAAVVTYDRWVALVSDGWDAGSIAHEKEQLAATLGTLTQAQAPEPGTAAPTSEPKKKDVTILYFPFDRDSLGATAQTAIGGVVGKIQAAPATAQVTINGHTDRAGTDAYNMDLSERRARYVLKALIAAGIPKDRMQYFAFGESDPAVPTADGVKEPRNRRAEIFIESPQ